jgi:formyltetrahydrofolate deformylase
MTVRCDDRPGIVHTFSQAILDAGGNIVENAQFGDELSGSFCMRTRFETNEADLATVQSKFTKAVTIYNAELQIHAETQRPRMLVMVSKFDHCLIDLLYRWRAGELPVDIPLIVSNHPDCAPIADREGIPYVHLPVTAANKAEQEAKLVGLAAEHQVDFVVLARYMQILSAELCSQYSGRIINIHHSFLPGFKGAKPYQQAYERGVKLIGATAHYVTSDLDEGPIIEQDVVRVSHASSAEDLAILGRDVERQVLARAVRLHAEHRLIMLGHRVVVFH